MDLERNGLLSDDQHGHAYMVSPQVAPVNPTTGGS